MNGDHDFLNVFLCSAFPMENLYKLLISDRININNYRFYKKSCVCCEPRKYFHVFVVVVL